MLIVKRVINILLSLFNVFLKFCFNGFGRKLWVFFFYFLDNGVIMLDIMVFFIRLLYFFSFDLGGDIVRESLKVGVVDGGKLIFKIDSVFLLCFLNDDIDEIFSGEFVIV